MSAFGELWVAQEFEDVSDCRMTSPHYHDIDDVVNIYIAQAYKEWKIRWAYVLCCHVPRGSCVRSHLEA